jgi:hypothetical protein
VVLVDLPYLGVVVQVESSCEPCFLMLIIVRSEKSCRALRVQITRLLIAPNFETMSRESREKDVMHGF